MVRTLLAALTLATVMAAAAPAPLDLPRLLDAYLAGRFDESVTAVAQAGDAAGELLRTQWRGAGRAWIDADPAAKSQRLVAAASFALETEHLRIERGAWLTPEAGVCPVLDPKASNPDLKSPAGPCVLEWAQSLFVERGAPDDAERAWVLTASALMGGVRDWRFLYRTAPGLAPDAPLQQRGILADALVRFPGDKRLLLEKAIGMASRYSVTTDGGGLATNLITVARGEPFGSLRTRLDPREAAIAELTALKGDPDVGAEAGIRLGYLLWALGDLDKARMELRAAAEAAREQDLQYLGRFLLGWTALNAKKTDDAALDLEAALKVRPDSQSAALALAAIELQRGEAGHAHAIAAASLKARPADDDPWRLFLYGHYARYGALVGELRKAVRSPDGGHDTPSKASPPETGGPANHPVGQRPTRRFSGPPLSVRECPEGACQDGRAGASR